MSLITTKPESILDGDDFEIDTKLSFKYGGLRTNILVDGEIHRLRAKLIYGEGRETLESNLGFSLAPAQVAVQFEMKEVRGSKVITPFDQLAEALDGYVILLQKLNNVTEQDHFDTKAAVKAFHEAPDLLRTLGRFFFSRKMQVDNEASKWNLQRDARLNVIAGNERILTGLDEYLERVRRHSFWHTERVRVLKANTDECRSELDRFRNYITEIESFQREMIAN